MHCKIQWIDCSGNPTPDTNEAVGFAVFKDGRRFPICASHLETLRDRRCHHEPEKGCSHRSSDPHASWHFEPLPVETT